MKNSVQLREEISALQAKVKAIVTIATEEQRELTDEETKELDSIQGTGDSAGQIDAVNKQLERAIKLETMIANMSKPNHSHLVGTIDAGRQSDDTNVLANVKIPAKARRPFNSKVFDSEEAAYASGQWVLATIGKNNRSRQWCFDHGILNAQSEGINTAGGFLVPDFFETSIIRIVEQYGVFRRNSYVYPMGSDTVKVPRRTSGYTVYYVGENTAITASDMAFSQVNLVARKPSVLTQVSSELNEDEVVGLATLMTQEFGYALALAEDQAGFLGDGTSTYGGIVGLKNALLAGSIADADTGDTTFATLDLNDFHRCKGLLPAYAGLQPKWYISQQGFALSMEQLAVAAGGTTPVNIAAGMQPMFLGSPVVFTQVLPTTSGAQTSTIVAYYGDLAMATTMGVRRQMRIDSDSSYYFNQDAIAVRCTERYDINIHETGTATVAGPIVALKTAAS